MAVTGAAVACLLAQLTAVRPVLSRRTERVLAGEDTGRSGHAHLASIGLEVVIKVAALLVLGVAAT